MIVIGGMIVSFSPPINCRSLLIFKVKKAVKAKVIGMKIQTRIYSRKLPESIKNAISFDVTQVKNFNIFMERLSLVVILCFCQWNIFQRWSVIQRFKGRGHEKFPTGKPPDPRFCLLCSHLVSTPPKYEFRSDGPAFIQERNLIDFPLLQSFYCGTIVDQQKYQRIKSLHV